MKSNEELQSESSSLPSEGQEDAVVSDIACELCGGVMLDRHCKLVCRNCGYQRDCSDP